MLVLNLMLSGDNIGVIALATRKLPDEHAKKASAIGIAAAMILRIILSCMVVWILDIQWLPIKLVGGLLLVKITWDFIKPQNEDEGETLKQSNNFWGAVITIIIADLTMSLDNVLAIASAADGQIGMMIAGLVMSLPILFFGSQIVIKLMKKYAIVIYIGGAILAHTSIKMIMEDTYVVKVVPALVAEILPWAAAAGVMVYGFFVMKAIKAAKDAVEATKLTEKAS